MQHVHVVDRQGQSQIVLMIDSLQRELQGAAAWWQT